MIDIKHFNLFFSTLLNSILFYSTKLILFVLFLSFQSTRVLFIIIFFFLLSFHLIYFSLRYYLNFYFIILRTIYSLKSGKKYKAHQQLTVQGETDLLHTNEWMVPIERYVCL